MQSNCLHHCLNSLLFLHRSAEPQVFVCNTIGATGTEACQALDKGVSAAPEDFNEHCLTEVAISAFACCQMSHAKLSAAVRVPTQLPSQMWVGL